MPVDFFAPFRTLGLDPRANITERDVKQAYRKLALTSHPDKNPNDPNAKSRFQKINTAHENALASISKLAEEQTKARAQQARKEAAHRKAQEYAAQEAARHRAQYVAAQEAARRAAAEEHEARRRAENILKANIEAERIRATWKAANKARAREEKIARQAIIARSRSLWDEIDAKKAVADARLREHESREQRKEEERKRQKMKLDTEVDDVKVGIQDMEIDRQQKEPRVGEGQRGKMKDTERHDGSEIQFPSAKRRASDGLHQKQPENADTESSNRKQETKARKEYNDTCDPITFTFNGSYADYDHDTWDAYASTDKRYKPSCDFSSLEDKVFRAIMNSRFEPCFARQSNDKPWLRTVMDDLWITQVLKDIFIRHGKTLYTEEKLEKETYGAFVTRAREHGVQFLEAWIQLHRGAK